MAKRAPLRDVRASFIKHAQAPAIDSAGAAQLLGVSRRRVNALALDDVTFPRPFTIIGGVRLWYRPGIQLWAAAHRPQQRRGHGVFGSEAGALLRLAEAVAIEFRHPGLGEDHLWLALLDPVAPGVVRDTFSSLGVVRDELLPVLLGAWPPGDPDGYPPAQRMSPAVQVWVSHASRHLAELGTTRVRNDAIALGLLDDWPTATRDPFARGGSAVTVWLARRGLDPTELRHRIIRASRDPQAVSEFERRSLPKRRPARKHRRSNVSVRLAPNPLGHDPRQRHPWGSIFARRRDGTSWIEDGRQYFFFYDRDRFRVMTVDGEPVGYWWESDPKPKPGWRPKGSRGETVLPKPGPEIQWPERLEMDGRTGLLARRPAR